MNINQPQLSPFVPTQFTFTRSQDQISAPRRAFIEWAKQIDPTHYFTFNFYDFYSMYRAQGKMDLFNYEMHQRSFRKHPSQVPDSRAIIMLAYPEYTKRGDIHYHAVVRVNPDIEANLLKIAAKRWKQIVPRGNLHIQRMIDTEADLERATVYMTKESSFEEWYIPKDYRGMAFADKSYRTQPLN